MPSKKSPVKEAKKMVIEDYNGQKSLWDGKVESSKVSIKIDSPLIDPSISTRNFLRKFTASNYLTACSALTLSSSKRYVVVELDSSLENLFQETQMKTIRLYVKYDRNSTPSFCPDFRVSFSKDISLNIKDKDRKSILWNGKQFVYKMKFDLTPNEMMNHTLETLLTPHAALNYLLKNCTAKLLSPKYENILMLVSMKDVVASFMLESSATIYLQNSTGEPITRGKEEDKEMDSDFELVPLPSCSSIEMINMEEISGVPKKSCLRKEDKKSPPDSVVPDNYNPWSNPDWKVVRTLIMQLERDTLTTMGYRHISEDDRKKLVTELWALNKAFKKPKADINLVFSHFKALQMVVTYNHPDAINGPSKESHKNKDEDFQNCGFINDHKPKKGHSNRFAFMTNSLKKNRTSNRCSKLAGKQEESKSTPSEVLPPFDYRRKKESSKTEKPAPKCPDCLGDLICWKCQTAKNVSLLAFANEEEECWFREERDRIGTIYIALALLTFILMLVLIYFV